MIRKLRNTNEIYSQQELNLSCTNSESDLMFEKLITIGNFVNKPIWGYPLNNLKHCRMNDYFPTRREKSFACQSPPPYITISPSHLADNNYIQVIQ